MYGFRKTKTSNRSKVCETNVSKNSHGIVCYDHFDDDFHGFIRVLWVSDDGGNELGLSGTDGTCG